jgi:YVTN family beta-propeller protein
MKKVLILFSAAIVLLTSCKKDSPDPVSPSVFGGTRSGGVLISNEGNYTQSNSSLTYVSPEGTLYSNIYFTQNQQVLGDILNSMATANNKVYLVVNNSGKIEVCDKNLLTRIKTLSLSSPRYMLPVSSSKAYVTDLSSNVVSIIDLNTDSITGSISIPGWTEELILLNNKVYVTNYNSDKIFVIDPLTDLVTDSIPAARFGNFLTSDANGNLWMLCTGDFASNPAELIRVNPQTRQVEFSHQFGASEYPSRLKKDPSGKTLYFINTDLMSISDTATVYPSNPFIPSDGSYLYGLGVSPSGNIYVTDALNFAQAGRVYIYTSGGSLSGSFKAGIAPGEFLFLP